MKNFILGIIFGIVCSGMAFATTDYRTFVDTEVDYPIFVNCKKMNFKNPAVKIQDVTYVPLREFCENNQIDVEWNDYSHWNSGKQWHYDPSEPKPQSNVKIILPFVQDKIQETVVEKELEFFTVEFEKELFGDKNFEKKEITTAHEAVKIATALAEQKLDTVMYDTALYTALYLERYEAWMVICNYPPQKVGQFECSPSTEWERGVIIDKSGRLLRTFRGVYTSGILNPEEMVNVFSRFDNNDLSAYLN